PPPFLGRDNELALLRRAYADRGSGHAVTVILRGESGIGKSALLREFGFHVLGEAQHAVVLAGRCYERESVAYKAFDQVIDALSAFLRRLPDRAGGVLLPRHAALLSRVFPVLGGVELIAQAPVASPEVTDPQELRRRMFAALRELFGRLAERH